MHIPLNIRLALLCLGLVVAILLLGLLKNVVVMPLVNNHVWLAPAKKRCVRKGTALHPLMAILVCNGHVQDTAEQITKLVRAAYCPTRLHIVVVHCVDAGVKLIRNDGPATAEKHDNVPDALAAHDLFRGTKDTYNIASRVTVVKSPVMSGNLFAMGIGLQKLLEDSGTPAAVFFAPCAEPVRFWDEAAVEDLGTVCQRNKNTITTEPGEALAGKAVLSCEALPDEDEASFPVVHFLSATNPIPLVKWMRFANTPELPHPAKLITSHAVAITRDAVTPDLLQALATMACAPAAGDVVLSMELLRQGCVLAHPRKALAQHRHSSNRERYRGALRNARAYTRMNVDSTRLLMNNIASNSGGVSAMMQAVLGLDTQTLTVNTHGIMGTLPRGMVRSTQELQADVVLKYGSPSAFNAVLDKVCASQTRGFVCTPGSKLPVDKK